MHIVGGDPKVHRCSFPVLLRYSGSHTFSTACRGGVSLYPNCLDLLRETEICHFLQFSNSTEENYKQGSFDFSVGFTPILLSIFRNESASNSSPL